MTDKKITISDLEKMIYDLGIELLDPMNGLIIKTLQKNFSEEFKDFDMVRAFECMVEEVNRVNNIIELYDILIELSREDLEKLLGDKNG